MSIEWSERRTFRVVIIASASLESCSITTQQSSHACAARSIFPPSAAHVSQSQAHCGHVTAHSSPADQCDGGVAATRRPGRCARHGFGVPQHSRVDLSAFMVCRFRAGVAIGASSSPLGCNLRKSRAKPRGALVGLFPLQRRQRHLARPRQYFSRGRSNCGSRRLAYKIVLSAPPAAILLAPLFGILHSPLVARCVSDDSRMPKILCRVGCADPRAKVHKPANFQEPQVALQGGSRGLGIGVRSCSPGLAAFGPLSRISAVLCCFKDIFAAAKIDACTAALQSLAIGLPI
jgi:hypothetical protein